VLTSAVYAFTAATIVYKSWFEGTAINWKVTALPI